MNKRNSQAMETVIPGIERSKEQNFDEREEILLEPYNYLIENPGKNVRTKLIEAFNVWLQVPADKMQIITDSVEMLHNASLLIDDIEDSSTMRRGKPVAHEVYGTPSTINCANYVYFLSLEKLMELKNLDLVQIFNDEICNLHRGQGMDLYWRDHNCCPTEEEYLDMIGNKTGGLLRLAIKLMQACGTVEMDVVPLVNKLGMHFQIRDDYINLASEEYMKEKGFCDDISEGKFSMPIIHCIKHDKHRRLLQVLKQKTHNLEELNMALNWIKEAGSLEYTLGYVVRLEAEAREEITRLGGNPYLSKILDALAQVYSQ